MTEARNSVSLTIEEGVNLVGPQCSERVRLLCKGAHSSTVIAWVQNGHTTIASFFTNARNIRPAIRSNVRVFEEVTVPYVFTNNGSFLSILTINLLRLYLANIANISCGNHIIKDTVTFEILDKPSITELTAIYAAKTLSIVRIQWKQVVSKYYIWLYIQYAENIKRLIIYTCRTQYVTYHLHMK